VDVELVPGSLPPPPVLQAWVLHACEDAPTHDAPPFAGVGVEQVRVSVPPPHVAEQVLQADQPPLTGSTAARAAMKVSTDREQP
jgi:hypothetical protein